MELCEGGKAYIFLYQPSIMKPISYNRLGPVRRRSLVGRKGPVIVEIKGL